MSQFVSDSPDVVLLRQPGYEQRAIGRRLVDLVRSKSGKWSAYEVTPDGGVGITLFEDAADTVEEAAGVVRTAFN